MPTLNIPFESDRHAKLLARVSQRMKLARNKQSIQWEKWMKAENKMVAYLHESVFDAKRRLRRDQSGQPDYTTIQIPYTYALVMTAHTYWTSVFFGRNPVHQFAGRNGTGEMQVQAMESLIQYQVDAGRFLAPYYLWFYDAAKYGQGVIGEWWKDNKIQYGSLESDPDSGAPTQVSRVIQTTCAKTNCLKQRLWTVEGLAPDAASEKSLIPCLEPCAMLMEAARKALRREQQKAGAGPVEACAEGENG